MARTVLLLALGGFLMLGGLAIAATVDSGVVVASITYLAGEIRPVTLNTDGELRVSCN